MTVIIVRGTNAKTLSLHLSKAWLLVVGLVVAGVLGSIVVLLRLNTGLRTDTQELTELRKTARLQQAEIDTMAAKSQETQKKLDALQKLEEEIRQLTGQTSSIPSRSETATETTLRYGRGGPLSIRNVTESLPTLNAMLPPDVSLHLFSARDTLDVNLRIPDTNSRKVADTVAKSEEVSQVMADQIKEMDLLYTALSEGKQNFADQKAYLAHRPTGLPVSAPIITDRFGYRWSPLGWGREFHNGVDLAQDYWTPIVATAEGVVTHAGWLNGGYGYAVVIDHGYGFETLYGHMVDWDVKVGQHVTRGDRIGWVGSTGNSTGAHVHYEVHYNGVPVDPTKYFQ
ncbi:MAG: peptidoglycan DD-metalloendopeptidase family protein [Mycobacterium leprae]